LVVSALTGAEAGLAYGLVGVSFLLLIGKTREAVIFTVVAMTIGMVSILGDYTLGEVVRWTPSVGQDWGDIKRESRCPTTAYQCSSGLPLPP